MTGKQALREKPSLPGSLRYSTPLRYPGGKQRLGRFFGEILRRNDLIGTEYAEPFAGGAGAGIYLLRLGLISALHINDLDRSLYAFWWSVVNRNARLQELLKKTPLTLAQWDKQKNIQRNKQRASLLALGFSTLFLNRTNRSGILSAGVIGGRSQVGDWLIDARFNRDGLVKRIATLGALSDHIHVTNLDAITFLHHYRRRRRLILYLDPPYFTKGPDLYLNRLTPADHKTLSEYVTCTIQCPWIMTYDDVPAIRALYASNRKETYLLDYSADARRHGRELMIISPGLRVPRLSTVLAATGSRLGRLRDQAAMKAVSSLEAP